MSFVIISAELICIVMMGSSATGKRNVLVIHGVFLMAFVSADQKKGIPVKMMRIAMAAPVTRIPVSHFSVTKRVGAIAMQIGSAMIPSGATEWRPVWGGIV